MLRSWPRGTWREEGDTDASRMLDLQVRLGNVARIDAFLAELSAEGHYAAHDIDAIMRASALLPAPSGRKQKDQFHAPCVTIDRSAQPIILIGLIADIVGTPQQEIARSTGPLLRLAKMPSRHPRNRPQCFRARRRGRS